MTQQNITSLFFSENNFLAITDAVHKWTIKTYGPRAHKTKNEIILEAMKSTYRNRDVSSNADEGDEIMILNKQVLRNILELISSRIFSETTSSTAALQSPMPSQPPFKFRLGDDHIIPKPEKDFLPSENPEGENNTMELYQKESKRRQAELDAAPTVNFPIMLGEAMSGTSLPTIMEEPNEDQDDNPSQYIKRSGASSLLDKEQDLPDSCRDFDLYVSDQADKHMQAVKQSQPQALKQVLQPLDRIATAETFATETLSRRFLDKVQSGIQNSLETFLKDLESAIIRLQSDRQEHIPGCQTSIEKQTKVFSTADRDLQENESLCHFSLNLEEGDEIKKLTIPSCLNALPYFKISFDEETKIMSMKEFGSEFIVLDAQFKAKHKTKVTLTDLDGNELYPKSFDIVHILAVQVQHTSLLMESGLHYLKEGDSVRFLEVECDDGVLKRELERKRGFAVTIIDHAHFAVSDFEMIVCDNIHIGSLMKLKKQVFVEYERETLMP